MPQMSPYRPMNNPHKGLKVRRMVTEISAGVKIPANPANWITLYENLEGRVEPLRKIDPNDLRAPKTSGDDKFGERKIILSPRYPLTKILRGDFISVPWGVKPNTFTPPNTPSNLGPTIKIGTPSGDQYLQWNGESYIGTHVSIVNIDGIWVLQPGAAADFFFDEGSFVNQEFPTGYSFKKSTGNLANFKILRIDEQQDNLGRIGFYSCSVDYWDTVGVHLVE